MIIGCYTLTLYCLNDPVSAGSEEEAERLRATEPQSPSPYGGTTPRHWDIHPSFTGQNLRDCKRQARQAGWVFRKGDVLCPECARDEVPISAPSAQQREER